MALFDPGEFPTETPVKVSPDFTVADVLAWARTKPASETYNYASLDDCAVAQFIRHAGQPLHGNARHNLESGDVGCCACSKPRTFGALASRLEALS